MEITRAARVKDAHGAYCATCHQVFDLASCQYWHWSKSAAMHRSGTGHTVEMFRFERSK